MRWLVLVAAACSSTSRASAPTPALSPPPADVVKDLGLSPRYVKYTAVHGFAVVGSAKVSDPAIREAAYLIDQMIGYRPEVLAALTAKKIRFVVMAPSEMTTDVPEHADLVPKAYWDRRARGIGATAERPATSCGEENLLNLDGDPYATENILVHEFSHTVQQIGIAAIDPTFEKRLGDVYEHARAAGLWKGTYAMTNASEYWAEGAQSWFDTNRVNDADHGPINTRAKLVKYDPQLAALLVEVYGDRPWRYHKLADRAATERAHLIGFDPKTAGRFEWPKAAASAPATALALVRGETPASPNVSADKTSLVFMNHRAHDVVIEWSRFDGTFTAYATLPPQGQLVQSTYVGHVWRVRDGSADLGHAAAVAGEAVIDIR